MIEYIKACLYGIIEGITEWLPISSTGHLILFGNLLKLDIGGSAEFGEQYRSAFDVVIQLGAILAVAVLYFARLSPFGKNKSDKKATLSLWSNLLLATLPAGVMGFIADTLCDRIIGKSLESLLFTPAVVASALIVYGILFIIVERLTAKEDSCRSDITPKTALAIGCFQALAIIPGTSRSGATILGARILGVSRKSAAEFSFLAALPVISAASLLKIFDLFSYISHSGEVFGANALLILLTAGSVAFFVSLAVIRFLSDFVKKHSFVPFGIYRIALGVAVLLFML